MKDEEKTKEQLLNELIKMRQRLTELQASETQHKQAEEAIKRLRRQTELILNSAGEGIFGLDLQERTTFINPAAARIVGYKIEELKGQCIHDILHHSKPDGNPLPSGKVSNSCGY